jgi:copper chaperone CopZ
LLAGKITVLRYRTGSSKVDFIKSCFEMQNKPANDQLAVIRIEGMHCHNCEETVRKAIAAKPGVHEVEVDFNSRQASVLYDPSAVKIGELMSAVDEVGYNAVSFTQAAADAKQ